MSHLWIMFCGYIKVSYPRIPWIFLFGLALLAFLEFAQHRSWIKVKLKGMPGVLAKVALSLLCSHIFVLMLFNRTTGNYDISLMPFSSYYQALVEGNTELLLQCIMNVVLFIMLGFLLPCCFTYFEKIGHVLIVIVLGSVCIEVIQGLAQIGYVEVDDVLNNVIGALLGTLLFKLVVKVR